MSAPAVIGLDLSITATGVADVMGDTFTIAGSAKDGDWRIHTIASTVAVLAADGCDLVVLERLAQGRHGGNGLAAAQVMGAVKDRLMRAGCRYVEVPPATLKKFATGKGNADKTDMALAAYKRAGEEFPDSDQCDAWWLRVAGLTALGHAPFELPTVQVDALAKVDWPEVSP